MNFCSGGFPRKHDTSFQFSALWLEHRRWVVQKVIGRSVYIISTGHEMRLIVHVNVVGEDLFKPEI